MAVELVGKESCTRFKEKERDECDTVDHDGDALISVSYDGAWQKRGKARDSITGFGTITGESTGKVLAMLLENMANAMQPGAEPLRIPPITSTRIYLEENSYPTTTFGQQSKML